MERDRRLVERPAGARRGPRSIVPDVHADAGEFQRLPGALVLRDAEPFPGFWSDFASQHFRYFQVSRLNIFTGSG